MEFYTEKYNKKLSLLAILTHGDKSPQFGEDTLVSMALLSLGEILEFKQSTGSSFSIIQVTTFEPIFSRRLAEVAVSELEDLNRYFKSQSTNEKIKFIENRIASVEKDLAFSEQSLKAFNEQNRQISSPALQLEQERLTRDVEIQKGIYLTLKQQLELAKIEEIQKVSIVQVLDKPQVPLGPSNKNLALSLLLASVLGTTLGLFVGFARAYTKTSDIDERKKLRRVKHFFKKKTNDIILDRRVSGIVSLLLLFGLPFYLGHESSNPVFFDRYSPKFMLLNTVYVLILLISIGLFIYPMLKRKKPR